MATAPRGFALTLLHIQRERERFTEEKTWQEETFRLAFVPAILCTKESIQMTKFCANPHHHFSFNQAENLHFTTIHITRQIYNFTIPVQKHAHSTQMHTLNIMHIPLLCKYKNYEHKPVNQNM